MRKTKLNELYGYRFLDKVTYRILEYGPDVQLEFTTGRRDANGYEVWTQHYFKSAELAKQFVSHLDTTLKTFNY